MSAPRAGGILATLVGRALRDARTRTLAFAYLFALYAYIQPVGFRHAYPKLTDRLAFVHSFAGNDAVRFFYGYPYDASTVGGYSAWRVGGTLAILAAVFGVLGAVRALRTEEDTGRAEIVLAGAIARRTVFVAAIGAVGAGVALLWLGETVGFIAGSLPVGESAYLALATATVAAVFAGVGALACQLAPARRIALELGNAVVAVSLLARVVADTSSGLGWLRWLTPLGWAEELRPFAGPQPLVLVLPVLATALVLGMVSASISSAGISKSIRREIARLGTGSIATPTGYVSFVFIFFVLAVSLFACAQIGAARQQEADEQLETLLALPVGRVRWLGGRLLLALCAAAALSLVAGAFTWAGASAQGVSMSLPRLLEAGANCLPTTVLFLGLAALAYALVPRASAGIAYGLVSVAFLWQLVGALLGVPKLLLELTPFAHVGLVPTQAFRGDDAAVMLAIGLVAACAGLAAFRRRDLLGT